MPTASQICPLCNDTGWKQVEGGRVTRCDCRIQSQSGRFYTAARIPRRYEHCTFANFRADFENAHPSIRKAQLKAERFVEDYPLDKTGLVFVGPAGVGKTHLAVSIVRDLILKKSIPCRFYEYGQLLAEIRNSYNPTVAETEMQVLRPVLDTEVLVLDEIGAQRVSDWVWDTVSYVLNTRYNRELTTILTTNFPDAPPKDLDEPVDRFANPKSVMRRETLGDRITERMRSRLHEMCRKVEMDGPDFRLGIRSRRGNGNGEAQG